MAQFDVVDMNGKKVSTVELSDAVFGITPNEMCIRDRIGHTPRKNPPAYWLCGGNLPHQRISRLAQLVYLHKPSAAKTYYNTRFPVLQVFFGIFIKFF